MARWTLQVPIYKASDFFSPPARKCVNRKNSRSKWTPYLKSPEVSGEDPSFMSHAIWEKYMFFRYTDMHKNVGPTPSQFRDLTCTTLSLEHLNRWIKTSHSRWLQA